MMMEERVEVNIDLPPRAHSAPPHVSKEKRPSPMRSRKSNYSAIIAYNALPPSDRCLLFVFGLRDGKRGQAAEVDDEKADRPLELSAKARKLRAYETGH